VHTCPPPSQSVACLLSLICLLGPASTRAGAPAAPAEARWKATCERARAAAPPPADQPDPAKQKELAGCKSEELFYGVGRAADPEQARLCAYVERAGGDLVVFGGSAMLMTIYATGVGAPRNVPLAIRFACELDGAPAEMEGRIAHLEALGAGGPAPKSEATFDLCDDATSGFMEGHCAAHRERLARARRDSGTTARLATWTPAERAGFRRLRARADGFFRARTANEVDLSGTARAALQIEEGAALERSFDELLTRLEGAGVPPASADALGAADRALNEAYGRIMKAEDPVAGTITRAGVRRTERAWLKYRDEWPAFARLKFPGADPRGIKAWLTRERVEMLQAFVATAPAAR
jgi:hypothetical protein